MATLNIRNLPDEVHRRLRVRAAGHGRSMEAEARAILAEACGETPAPTKEARSGAVQRLQTYLERIYPDGRRGRVVDEFLAERRRDWDPE